MEIVVIVQDVQDQPPVFTLAPPVTKLPPGILPGDKILQVHAEDGDKGSPREVRYGLVSEGNPFTSFFDINDTSVCLLSERGCGCECGCECGWECGCVNIKVTRITLTRTRSLLNSY
ncbi:cadherin-86C-like [Teleopsis dalmanni]|uniref:cadherin-86C-like n=1 Tax=Teleopsis dalmanni TaxID=139649 RepID=UPI0018CE750A|nr:cadherin-86C-like [Teleopsis dalmanni]